MTNFIPIFPLELVVYPGEKLNLHIFEPRYKQLIGESVKLKKPFGVPAVVNKKLNEMGTLVEVTEVVEEYKDGEMDIKTKGVKVFRMLEVIKEVPEKLYSGAIVNYPDNTETGSRVLMQKIMEGIKELHTLLKITKEFKKPAEELTSYDVAHHIGLSLEEEYDVLGILTEIQRQEYLKRHLQKVLPLLSEMENLKDKIKLNGHFKNLSTFDL